MLMKIKHLMVYLGDEKARRRPIGDRLSINIPFTDGKKLMDKVGTFLPMQLG
jgi:hypothetical protein